MRFHESRFQKDPTDWRRGVWPALALALCGVVFLVALSGCAAIKGQGQENYITITYRTLAATKAGYYTSLMAAADLYDQGVITDAEKNDVIRQARKVKIAYDAARNAMIAFQGARTSSERANVDERVATMNGAYAALLALAAPMIDLMNLSVEGGAK